MIMSRFLFIKVILQLIIFNFMSKYYEICDNFICSVYLLGSLIVFPFPLREWERAETGERAVSFSGP